MEEGAGGAGEGRAVEGDAEGAGRVVGLPREALGLVDQVVSRIAALLRPYEDRLEGMEPAEAARWVFSALVSELLQDVVGRGTPDRQAALRARVRVLLRGLGAA